MKKIVSFALVSTALMASINDGVIGYYRFDGNTKEAMRLKLNAQETRPSTYLQGIDDKARLFSGKKEDTLRINNFPSLSKKVSLSAWILPHKLEYTINPLVSWGESTEPLTLWVSYNNIALLVNGGYDNASWCNISLPKEIHDDVFVHVGATYNADKGQIRLFLSGKAIGSCAYHDTIISTKEPLFIGVSPHGNYESFRGLIDELRIYEREITSEQMAELAKKGQTFKEYKKDIHDDFNDFKESFSK